MLQEFVQNAAPKGCLTLVCGLPLSGKSTFLAWLASRFERTAVFASDRLRPAEREFPLIAENGADPNHVFRFDSEWYGMPCNIKSVGGRIMWCGANLVLVDSMRSSFGAGYSPYHYRDVGQVLSAWKDIARLTGAAVVGSHSLPRSGKPIPAGSIGFTAVPDVILQLAYQHGETTTRSIRWLKHRHALTPPEVPFFLVRNNPDAPPRFVPGWEAFA